ncbi:MAG: hypothetical protein ACLQDY_02335 [Streptosporangiaceae bacterium]
MPTDAEHVAATLPAATAAGPDPSGPASGRRRPPWPALGLMLILAGVLAFAAVQVLGVLGAGAAGGCGGG